MIIIILFFYLFMNKKTNAFLIKNVNLNNLIDGFDNRYLNNISDIDYNMLFRIKTNIKKKQLLNILEDKNTPIHYKLNLLHHNQLNIVAPNISACNLMKNF